MIAAKTRKRVLRIEVTRKPATKRQQHRVADDEAETLVDVLEAIDVDDEHRRPDRLPLRGARDRALQTIHEQLAIGQTRQAVMHGIVHQTLMRPLDVRHIAQQTDTTQQPHILVMRRLRVELVPKIGSVVAAQAKIRLERPAFPLLQRLHEQLEALPIRSVHMLQEFVHRDVQRPGFKPEFGLHLVPDGDEIAPSMPLKHLRAGAIDRQGLHLDETWRTEAHRRSARVESELGDGEAEQDENKNKPGDQARSDDLAGQLSGDNHRGPEQPNDQQHPARDQRHGTVLTAQREIGDQDGSDAGDDNGRGPRKPGRRLRIDNGDCDERELGRDPHPKHGLDPHVP